MRFCTSQRRCSHAISRAPVIVPYFPIGRKSRHTCPPVFIFLTKRDSGCQDHQMVSGKCRRQKQFHFQFGHRHPGLLPAPSLLSAHVHDVYTTRFWFGWPLSQLSWRISLPLGIMPEDIAGKALVKPVSDYFPTDFEGMYKDPADKNRSPHPTARWTSLTIARRDMRIRCSQRRWSRHGNQNFLGRAEVDGACQSGHNDGVGISQSAN